MAETEFESKVELPGGNWVELRDPYNVTERERKPLKRAFIAMGKAGQAAEKPGDAAVTTPLPPQLGGRNFEPDVDLDLRLDAMEDFESKIMVFFVEAWSFDSEPSEDALLDIPATAYIAIDEAVGERMGVLFPELAKKTEENPTTP